ncbi:MAG: hypothetical protein EBQ89_07215, partial [Alphaproteobacteria bacterium]|nr:hypothetical protein [Alphaproteobacteria bacterium]
MMRWAFLDDALAYTGATLRGAPMGGIQAATVQLAEALAARGHTATVYNRVGEISQHYGVTYAPLEKINTADVVVANCAPKLFSPKNFARHFFSEATQKTKKILWMHGPASYMQKPKHLWPYILHGPRVVFSSHYQRRTWPAWLPQQSVDIPLGLGAMFLGMAERQPPPPVAIFLSNPRRGLDWLVNLWQTRVFPVMPAARLHVYGGRAVYGNRQDGALDKALS